MPRRRACSTTINRWRLKPAAEDARRGPKTRPRNALSEQEQSEVVAMMNAAEHSSMSPDALVPYLATLGVYLASQSTLCIESHARRSC